MYIFYLEFLIEIFLIKLLKNAMEESLTDRLQSYSKLEKIKEKDLSRVEKEDQDLQNRMFAIIAKKQAIGKFL